MVYEIYTTQRSVFSGEDGIRTHVPVRTNGFQDRLVMTASIPLRIVLFPTEMFVCLARTNDILAKSFAGVNDFPRIFIFLFSIFSRRNYDFSESNKNKIALNRK